MHRRKLATIPLRLVVFSVSHSSSFYTLSKDALQLAEKSQLTFMTNQKKHYKQSFVSFTGFPALGIIPVVALTFDWFIRLSAPVMIGRNNREI